MRTLLHTALASSPEIVSALPGGLYDFGSVGGQEGAIPAHPFLVQKLLIRSNGPAKLRSIDLRAELWVYGPPQDFTVIEDALTLVRNTLHNRPAISRAVPGGKLWLTSVEYLETSQDFPAPEYQANVKWDTYRLVGNYEYD